METRLDELYQNAQVIEYDREKKFVFFSDLHLGKRAPDDAFQPNEKIFLDTLNQYSPSEWTLCLGGDIYDLWKNQFQSDIVSQYPTVFGKMDPFKIFEIVGNHDRELQNIYPEAYRLKNKDSGKEIFWHHGYADDLLNDQLWQASRDFLRYVIAPVEDITKLRSLISPAANADRHAEVRTRLKAWANGNKITSIFGHIHYQEHDGYYWNDGCGVHVGSIECIEMVNDELGVRVFKS